MGCRFLIFLLTVVSSSHRRAFCLVVSKDAYFYHYCRFHNRRETKSSMFLHLIHLIHRELSKHSVTSLSLTTTQKLHALIISTKLSPDPFYVTQLVRLYGIHGKICSARKLFDECPHRSVFLWNAMIRSYAQAHMFSDSFSLFSTMLRSDIDPDSFTYACLVRACSDSVNVHGLKLFHAKALVFGLRSDSVVSSSLVSGYSKLCLVDEASKVFYAIARPDLVLWNTMISCYGNCGFWVESLRLFNLMLRIGNNPDGYTIVGLLFGLGDSRLVNTGQSIHGFCLKSGFDSNIHVASALVSMYSKCKSPNALHKLDREILLPDLVSWSSLITGYAQSGEHRKALSLLKELTFSGTKPDSVLTASALAIASQMANARHGMEIHGYAIRQGLECDFKVCSSLVDMYSKSGLLRLGIRVFETTPRKNIVSYNALILGFALHGFVSRAFEKFEEILENGLVPDESTFSALLCACCHSGRIEEGKYVFNRMSEFSVKARTEHYIHLVKLLGMNGGLDEAYRLVQSLPQPVDHGVWGALLSCCDVCGDFELAEIVSRKLLEENPKSGSYRVMVSNVYSSDGRSWDNAMKLRDSFDEGTVLKTPGISWIECNNNYPLVA